MKISVIVPIYKCEKYLCACIESIVSQTYVDLEIILVDDGSPDDCGVICDKYAAEDKRIKVIHQLNQGVSAARNAALDIAEGDLITFVDADDTVESDMYEILVRLIEEHKADIAHCGYKKIHFDGTEKEILGTKQLLVQNSWEAAECLILGKHFTGSPCTKLYRKELFSQCRFDKDLKINEDILLNVQLFSNARKIVFWDVAKYCYYEREQSATRTTNRLKTKRDCVAVSEKILEQYKNTKLESICAAKLKYSLLDLYRTCLMTDFVNTKEEREIVNARIIEVSELCKKESFRGKLNYRFMRTLPKCYVSVYKIFDRIRTPNIDL